jgi:hypothetical protein
MVNVEQAPTRIIHEDFYATRRFAAFARQMSFVNGERDKQDVRDGHVSRR